MAFGSPSLQKPYFLASSFDPAFDLPVVPELAEDASEADIEARNKIAKERDLRYRAAVDTGNYAAICKPGMQPSLFECRPIHGPSVSWMHGERERNRRVDAEMADLCFRLGVRKVDISGIRLEFEVLDGHQMITLDSLQQVYSIDFANNPKLGRKIVGEIGQLIFDRALGVRPLS